MNCTERMDNEPSSPLPSNMVTREPYGGRSDLRVSAAERGVKTDERCGGKRRILERVSQRKVLQGL